MDRRGNIRTNSAETLVLCLLAQDDQSSRSVVSDAAPLALANQHRQCSCCRSEPASLARYVAAGIVRPLLFLLTLAPLLFFRPVAPVAVGHTHVGQA